MKRLLMILCMTVLLAVVLAVPAFAAEGHTHCLCNGQLQEGCAHSEVTFTEVTSVEALKTALAGDSPVNVCIVEDFTISESISVSGKILNLCLNGNTITMSGSAQFLVESAGVLNITDCATASGAITAAADSTASMIKANGGLVTLLAGTVDATDTSANGGAIYLDKTGDIFTMYDGTLLGSKKAAKGGAVYAGGNTSNTTEVNIHGGEITGGCAAGDTNGTGGGGICIEYNCSKFVLSGDAKIYGNDGVDVRLNGKDTNLITLGDWEGNGEYAKLSVYKLTGTQKKIVDLSASNVKADAATYFAASGGGYELVYDESAKTLSMGAHKHCNCLGKLDHTHSTIEYQEVSTADAFIAAVGAEGTDPVNVCLTGVFTLSSSVTISGKTVNLCLNGYTLTVTGAKLTVNNSGTLNITACNGGTIKAGSAASVQIIRIDAGNLALYGGTIDASVVSTTATTEKTYSGGAVYVTSTTEASPSSTFAMYGGKIIGAVKVPRGGAVYLCSGHFIMHGGEIVGGTAQYGGAVGVNYGSMTMTGGTITGGTATTAGGGVNIHYAATSFTLSGTAKIYGNTCNDQANDVNIGINKAKDDFLTLGQWEGNGVDKEGNARVLNLTNANATAVGYTVIKYAQDVTDYYAMKSHFAVAGYQLMATAEGMTVQDQAAHIHCICGGELAGTEGHSCEDMIFTAATQDSFVPDSETKELNDKLFETVTKASQIRLKGNMNIYLNGDVEIDSQFMTSGYTLNLCLGEHSITAKDSGRITANRANGGKVNGTLNITGCSDDGVITAETGCNSGILYTYNGHINLYSGKVDVSSTTVSPVTVDTAGNGDTFTMYGGKILAANTAGGAVSVKGGQLILNGGIIDATGKSITGNGGAIVVANNTKATGLQLQGFSNDSQMTNSSSARGELLATAMAVTDARGDTVLIISADACKISESICNKLRLNISRETGLPM